RWRCGVTRGRRQRGRPPGPHGGPGRGGTESRSRVTDTIREPPSPPPVPDEAAERRRQLLQLVLFAVLMVIIAALNGGLVVLAIVAALIVVVMLHELGHLVTAKWAGMKVTEYFLGFGPRLWSVRRG